jgi:hypothetical protein
VCVSPLRDKEYGIVRVAILWTTTTEPLLISGFVTDIPGYVLQLTVVMLYTYCKVVRVKVFLSTP